MSKGEGRATGAETGRSVVETTLRAGAEAGREQMFTIIGRAHCRPCPQGEDELVSCPNGLWHKSGSLLQLERTLREPSDARQDLVGGLRPDEGSALGVVLCDELVNGRLERAQRFDVRHAARNPAVWGWFQVFMGPDAATQMENSVEIARNLTERLMREELRGLPQPEASLVGLRPLTVTGSLSRVENEE